MIAGREITLAVLSNKKVSGLSKNTWHKCLPSFWLVYPSNLPRKEDWDLRLT